MPTAPSPTPTFLGACCSRRALGAPKGGDTHGPKRPPCWAVATQVACLRLAACPGACQGLGMGLEDGRCAQGRAGPPPSVPSSLQHCPGGRQAHSSLLLIRKKIKRQLDYSHKCTSTLAEITGQVLQSSPEGTALDGHHLSPRPPTPGHTPPAGTESAGIFIPPHRRAPASCWQKFVCKFPLIEGSEGPAGHGLRGELD